MKQATDLQVLRKYRVKLAALVLENEAYSPIFLRIEEEIAAGEAFVAATATNDILARARAIARPHKAMA